MKLINKVLYKSTMYTHHLHNKWAGYNGGKPISKQNIDESYEFRCYY